MLTQILGWTGSALLAWGLFGIGNKNRNAFFFSIAGESLWIVKSAMLGMWDLAAICCVFLFMAVRAYRAWGIPQPQDCTRPAEHAGPCNGYCCRE